MRGWLPTIAVVLGFLALATGLVMRVRSQERSVPDGPWIRPGVYKTTWLIPKPDRHALGNKPAGTVDYTSPPKSTGRTLSRISATLVMCNPNNRMRLALESSDGKNYDTLFVDANRNADLSDDKPLRGVLSKDKESRVLRCYTFISAARMPLNKLIPTAEATNPVVLDFYVDQMDSRVLRFEARTRGCWSGSMDSDKGPIRFRILDYDMNGRYSDVFQFLGQKQHGGDMVAFDWSGKGDLVNRFGDYPGYVAASSPANVFGRLLVLAPSESGDRLTISRFDGPGGRVAVRAGTIGNTVTRTARHLPYTRLCGPTQTYSLPVDGTPLKVPTGRYYLQGLEVVPVGDGDSPNWLLDYTPRGPVEVAQGKETSIDVQGQLKLEVKPQEDTLTRKRGEAVGIETALLLSDLGFAAITEESGFSKRGTGFVLPAMQMRDSQGKVIYRGQVDWADEAYMQILADHGTIPKTLKPGKYTYEIEYDTGPFGGVLKARKTVVVK